jgi:hypothetical protein
LGSTASLSDQEVVDPAGTTTTIENTSGSSSVVGQPVTFTATVDGSGYGSPSGSVDFVDTTTTANIDLGPATITNSWNGSSYVSTASLTTTALAAGADQDVTAHYLGDANFTGSYSTSVEQGVARATTTTIASSWPNPGALEHPITFTATVIGQYGGTPGGDVSFYDGTTLLDVVSLVGNSASLTTSTLAMGPHSISAQYSGDSNYHPSTSPAIDQEVGQGTTITVVNSSANPAIADQPVTLSATVSPGSGLTTGEMVDFWDLGATTWGTTPQYLGDSSLDSSGNASLIVPGLA